jgi:hypothetical protein
MSGETMGSADAGKSKSSQEWRANVAYDSLMLMGLSKEEAWADEGDFIRRYFGHPATRL